jgi:sulfite exporter TauE/SafE
MFELLTYFFTGLTTGGVSCAAMQGGLLASTIANQKKQEIDEIAEVSKELSKKERRAAQKSLKTFDKLDWMPVGAFLITKLAVHALLGLLLGALGSVLSLSLGMQLAFQTFAALFMIATAMNLLEVHPIFRFMAFQPPKFMQRWVRNTTKSRALFAPAILGAMTVFIPCGVTQAMEVVAINSGSPLYGMAIMVSFVLGTSPMFTLIGLFTARFSELMRVRFTRIAAYSLIIMAIVGVNGVMTAANSPVTLQGAFAPLIEIMFRR